MSSGGDMIVEFLRSAPVEFESFTLAGVGIDFPVEPSGANVGGPRD
jgi:hypothetical protein